MEKKQKVKKQANLTIDILGTPYEIVFTTKEENDKLEEADGVAELFSKRLVVELCKPTRKTFEKLEEHNKKVIRHEMVHAFLHESGLQDYSRDEVLTSWIALQIPKMVIAMKQAKAI